MAKTTQNLIFSCASKWRVLSNWYRPWGWVGYFQIWLKLELEIIKLFTVLSLIAFAIWILKITFLYNVNLKCKILHRPIKSRSFTFIIIFELDWQITKLTNKQYKAMLTKLFRTRYRYIFIISLYLFIELKGATVWYAWLRSHQIGLFCKKSKK